MLARDWIFQIISFIFLLLEAMSLFLEFILKSYVIEVGFVDSFGGFYIYQVYIFTVLGRWLKEGRLILPFFIPQSIQCSAYLISGSPLPSISIQCEVVIFILYLFAFFSYVFMPISSLLLNLSFLIPLSQLLFVAQVLIFDSTLCPFFSSPLSLQWKLSFDFYWILSICFRMSFLFYKLYRYFLVPFIFASQFQRHQRYSFYQRMAVLSVWIYSGRKSMSYQGDFGQWKGLWGSGLELQVLCQSFVSTLFIYSIFFRFFYLRFCFAYGRQNFAGERESYFFFVAFLLEIWLLILFLCSFSIFFCCPPPINTNLEPLITKLGRFDYETSTLFPKYFSMTSQNQISNLCFSALQNSLSISLFLLQLASMMSWSCQFCCSSYRNYDQGSMNNFRWNEVSSSIAKFWMKISVWIWDYTKTSMILSRFQRKAAFANFTTCLSFFCVFSHRY